MNIKIIIGKVLWSHFGWGCLQSKRRKIHWIAVFIFWHGLWFSLSFLNISVITCKYTISLHSMSKDYYGLIKPNLELLRIEYSKFCCNTQILIINFSHIELMVRQNEENSGFESKTLTVSTFFIHTDLPYMGCMHM